MPLLLKSQRRCWAPLLPYFMWNRKLGCAMGGGWKRIYFEGLISFCCRHILRFVVLCTNLTISTFRKLSNCDSIKILIGWFTYFLQERFLASTELWEQPLLMDMYACTYFKAFVLFPHYPSLEAFSIESSISFTMLQIDSYIYKWVQNKNHFGLQYKSTEWRKLLLNYKIQVLSLAN